MKGPVGVSKHFPGDNDDIRLTRRHDLLRLHGLRDQADGACRDSDAGADLRRKGDLVTGTGGDAGIGNQSAARAVDQVDADSLEAKRKLDGLRQVPPPLDPVRAGESRKERQVRRPGLADGPGHLQREPHPAFQASPVRVRPSIGQRGEELVQQIAVGHVDLHDLESRLQAAAGRFPVPGDQALQVGGRQLAGHGRNVIEGDGAGPEGLPAALVRCDGRAASPGDLRGGLAAGVRDLDGGHGALRLDKGRDAPECLPVPVGPDAEIAVGDPALGRHGRGLDHDLPGPAHGATAEMDEVPVVGNPVPGAVLAHGGQEDSIPELDPAQLQRREQLAHLDSLSCVCGYGRASVYHFPKFRERLFPAGLGASHRILHRSTALRLHQPLSYPFVRQPLRRAGPAFLPEIQTAADFIKSKINYIEVDERERRP